MKAIFSFVISLLITQAIIAQAPQAMSYQAVIRNAANGLVTNREVGIRLSILQGSASGAAVYVETQNPIANANGLVSLEIGSGTVVSGSFAAIDWSTGTYFLKTETDPTGGTNFTIIGTSQLLSVPYALNAQTAQLGGMNVKKLHPEDELHLIIGPTIGPNETGSSVNIGDITSLKGLILEWRMDESRPDVFQQLIYLSPHDKDVIVGNIPPPAHYPRRYVTILSDGAATIQWLGVSIEGTQLFLSSNSLAPNANLTPRLERVFGIL